MKNVKYYTIAAVTEETELNPYGKEYIGTVQLMGQAIEAAKRIAAKHNKPVEVTQCCIDSTMNRTVKYFPDGTHVQLWKL